MENKLADDKEAATPIENQTDAFTTDATAVVSVEPVPSQNGSVELATNDSHRATPDADKTSIADFPVVIDRAGAGTKSPIIAPQESVAIDVVAAPPPSSSSAATRRPSLPASNKPTERGGGGSGGSSLTVDQAREVMGRWGSSGKISRHDFDTLLVLLQDHESLREKVSKLKTLLGRSALAQREGKVTQKRLDAALLEIERLQQRIDKLSNRPTHMDLLADFETNFDRALLSVGQAGGQNTASSSTSPSYPKPTTMQNSYDDPIAIDSKPPVIDGMLMQELEDHKQRISKLEQLNVTLGHRAAQHEREVRDTQRERDSLATKVSHLELEKKMATMEADHAKREMQAKAASLAEMQMEIDLVTKASVNANARAAHGAELMKTVKTDREHVVQLEEQVKALQEWALASTEAKTLAQERVKLLEQKLAATLGKAGENLVASPGANGTRVLCSHTGSCVVGAGDIGAQVVVLGDDMVRSVRLSERVILKWHFVIKSTSDDRDIGFSVYPGKCPTLAEQKKAVPLLKERKVKGGGEGEVEKAFEMQRCCTVLWSNTHSWIRPRTIQFTLEAIVLSEDD